VVPGNFLFHLMFFPAASFLAGEEFGVVAAVVRLTPLREGREFFPESIFALA